MNRSVEHFLTTHTGSLPRPDDLIRMMFAKEEGIPVDRAALAGRIRAAVAEVVGKQSDAGIAVPSDGEVSKQRDDTIRMFARVIEERVQAHAVEEHENVAEKNRQRMADEQVGKTFSAR